MQPRKPTLAELEDIFTSQHENKIERLHMGRYDYAISKLRTEYEALEDELDDVELFNDVYSKEEQQERRNKVLHKLDSVHWAIERLKEVNE